MFIYRKMISNKKKYTYYIDLNVEGLNKVILAHFLTNLKIS